MRSIAIIMAGGKGERFWPLSREDNPKQFLRIKGDKELIEATYERTRPLFDHVVIVTTRRLEDKVRERFKDASIIAEPEGKNTGPCVAVATLFAKENGYSLVGVFPADHYIEGIDGFRNNVKDALSMAQKGFISTIGIRPNRADTGFGYIERGDKIQDGIYKVVKFHEKPELEKAKTYYSSGRFYWNAGMFFWKTDVFFEEVQHYAPFLLEPLKRYSLSNLEDIYKDMPSISIDYALLEKTKKAVVIESSFFWEDLGSYIALERVFEKNKMGNIDLGESIEIDARGNIIVSESGLVAVLGIEGLVVVHTKDVTLVLPKDRAQEVKNIVKKLREEGKKDYL